MVTGAGAGNNVGARKSANAAGTESAAKVKKLKGQLMEDPISDEDEMFAEKTAPQRRLAKDSDEFIVERNKKYVPISLQAVPF